MQLPLKIICKQVKLKFTNLTFLRNPHYDNRFSSDSQAATEIDQ